MKDEGVTGNGPERIVRDSPGIAASGDEAMDWKAEVSDLRSRELFAARMGGPDKVKRHQDSGKLTVRERIYALVDPGSFHEVGAIAGKFVSVPGGGGQFQPANFVMGRARINGRDIVVGGDDFTVRGGASDAAIAAKQVWAEQFANEYRLPMVRLVDGSGGGGSIRSLEGMGHTYVPEMEGWEWVVDNLGTVPVISLALGSVAGLGAARVVASHYSVMVKDLSQVFVAGPPLVAAVGEQVTKEELGGSQVHARNGVVTDEVGSEDEAFECARRFLSYLPSSVFELPERIASSDDPARRDDWLIGAIPRRRRSAYKIRPIINALTDRDSFFELGRLWGRSAVTGFARLDGWPIAMLASDPYIYGGGMTADASQKIEWFIELADTFKLPVVHLVDQPGFVIGTQAEQAATIRFGARALAAVYQASVPWCSVILRRCFGVGGAAHRNAARVAYRYAWPSGDWGSLPPEGGIQAAYRAQLEASEHPDQLLQEIEQSIEEIRSPFRTAEAFGIEEIIDPRDTRPLLCEFANLAARVLVPGPTSWRFRG